MQVTVVGQDELPFAKQFGRRVGTAIRRLHEDRGVRFRLGGDVERIGPDTVILKRGEVLAGGLVVAGVGVDPVVDYASGLEKPGTADWRPTPPFAWLTTSGRRATSPRLLGGSASSIGVWRSSTAGWPGWRCSAVTRDMRASRFLDSSARQEAAIRRPRQRRRRDRI